jgi:RNA polymerase sigma-70 factor (ECF subfamily)
MDEASEEEGVKMAANAVVSGPAIGLEDVFRAHHGRVFRAAYRITGDPHDAEDVLQTVFLRLMRQGGPAGTIGNLETYLHRAAVNAALDLVRARRNWQKVPLEDIEPVLRDDRRLEPDRRQSAGELRSLLRKAITRLSPRAAEMFTLRYFEGFDNPEIARMLGTSVTNVAVTLHRTRGQLQMELRTYRETGL